MSENRTPVAESQRTIGQLVADATHDVQGLVKSEIALAKAEVQQGAKVLGKGAGLLAGAGAEHVGRQLAVVDELADLAAVLGLIGKNALSKARPKPERAIAEAEKTIAALKG